MFYGGGLRQVSDDNGFTCYLLKQFHTGNYTGDTRAIHQGNVELDLWLKRACQREFEKTHSREEFMKLIGRNYKERDE